MTLIRHLTPTTLLLLVALSACVPQADIGGPIQFTYNAPARNVFAIVVQTITNTPAPGTVNGWRIVQRNRDSGYIFAQAFARDPKVEARQSLTVQVSSYRPNRTTVVMQFTEGEGNKLANRVRIDLRRRLRGTLLQIIPPRR